MRTKKLLAWLLSVAMILSVLPTNLVFADDTGATSSESDVLILTLAELEAFRDEVNSGNTYEGKYVLLGANIDLGEKYGAGKGDGGKDVSWTPIGTAAAKFKGTFDGGDNEISGMYINSSESHNGLFGYVDYGTVKNVGVSGVVNSTGNLTAGVAGFVHSGRVENCYNKAEINSSGNSTGGVVGYISDGGVITNCYNSGAISSTDNMVGGIVGQTYEVESVDNCYNTGSVTGASQVGGIAGFAMKNVSNCYNIGLVNGSDTKRYGAIIGSSDNENAATDCYYLDTCVSGGKAYGTAKTADEFKSQNTFANWDFMNIWEMSESVLRPTLKRNIEGNGSAAKPYMISTLTDLENFRDSVNKGKSYYNTYFKLGADIDMSTKYGADKGVSWTPIGTYGYDWASMGTISHLFEGTFDGDGHKITGLYINEDSDMLGLFKRTTATTVIKNLAVSGSINAKSMVGAFVGYNFGTIENCYNECDITVSWNCAGGIVGSACGTIKNCYNVGDIVSAYSGENAASQLGGIVGNSDLGTVENCYSTGNVTGDEYIGGIAGLGSATNSFYLEGSVSGTLNVDDGTAISAEAFVTQSTFEAAGWDFENTWIMGNVSPMLKVNPEKGTRNNPDVTIETLAELEAFRDEVNSGNTYEGKYVLLGANIDMSEKYGADKGVSWTPIGTNESKFKGTFDGDGYKIIGIYTNTLRSGLFRETETSAVIKNLSIYGQISGDYIIGAVVAVNRGRIENCINGCSVTAEWYTVGGIAGENYGEVENCCNTGEISSTDTSTTGGIVAYNIGGVVGCDIGGVVKNCYNIGDVSGIKFVGGVVGYNDGGTVGNCYNKGEINGYDCVGGVVGFGRVSNSYSVGTVTGTASVGGIAGLGSATNSFYLEGSVSGTLNVDDGTAISAEAFALQSTFEAAGWDFANTWVMGDVFGKRPILKNNREGGNDSDTYIIESLGYLEDFRNDVNRGNSYEGKTVKLGADIDMSTKYGADKIVSWTPIGTDESKFKGTFDGDGHKITGMYTNTSNSGLFRETETTTVIKNLSIYGQISGHNTIGAIAAVNRGRIENCINGCSVTAELHTVGGIAGENYGEVENCGNVGDITSTDTSTTGGAVPYIIGGVVGYIGSSSLIYGVVKNCYNIGDVNGIINVGGVVGYNNGGTVGNCYNKGEINGYECVGGVAGFGRVFNSYSVGTVTSTASVGGISGAGIVTNSFYLEGNVSGTLSTSDGVGKSADDFANGAVAWALQNGQGDQTKQVWGQNLTNTAAEGETSNKDENPVLTDAADKNVKKVTFMQTSSTAPYAERFVNVGKTVGENMPSEPTSLRHNFLNWAKTNDIDGEVFDKDSVVNNDMTVYAVGSNKTFSEGDIVNLTKGKSVSINLIDCFKDSMDAEKNFEFALHSGKKLPDGLNISLDGTTINGTPEKTGVYAVTFDVINKNISLMSVGGATVEQCTLMFVVALKQDESADTTTYLIEDLNDLEYFRDNVAGKNSYKNSIVRLENNIDLSEVYGEAKGKSWMPIGISELVSDGTPSGKKLVPIPFEGTFDGNGKEISNLYIASTKSGVEANYMGLFGVLVDATVKNLTVSGSINTPNAAYVGGVTGYAKNSVIENCVNKCAVKAKTSVGGIVGIAYDTTITRCANSANITATNSVGGIGGYFAPGNEINDSYNIGEINGDNNVGGLVGFVRSEETNKNAVNLSYNVGLITAENDCGAIIGAYNDADIYKVYRYDSCAATGTSFTNSAGQLIDLIDFKSCRMAWILQDQRSEQVWGQSISGAGEKDEYPILTDLPAKRVYLVEFAVKDDSTKFKGYAEVYTNEGTITLPPDPPATAEYVFSHWSKTKDANGEEFTEDTVVSSDMSLYAVGREQTQQDAIGVIKLQKSVEVKNVSLKDYVSNVSGTDGDFTFSLADGAELPQDLNLSSDGKITGTPKEVGFYDVDFKVQNNGLSLMSAEPPVDEITLRFNIALEGEGSKTNPYKISKLSELEYFRDDVNNGNGYGGEVVRLENDIDLVSKYNNSTTGISWTPIGKASKRFKGTFDGNNCEVQNMYISAGGGIDRGLFAYVDTGATVKNLGVTGEIRADNSVGAITSCNYGTIENCYADCTIKTKAGWSGGIASRNHGTIKKCYNVKDISADDIVLGGNIGGIVGYNYSTVQDCYNLGKVSDNTTGASDEHSRYVGGIVGQNDGNIYRCFNAGKIYGTDKSGGISGSDSTEITEVKDAFYLDSCAYGSTTLNSVGEQVSEAVAESGEIAYRLQAVQPIATDGVESEQVWGQRLCGTKDKYPMLSSSAEKAVKKVELWANKAYLDSAYTMFKTAYTNSDGGAELPKFDGLSTINKYFAGWSATEGGEKIDSTYVIADGAKLFSVWNTVTFEVSDTQYTYKADTPRKITFTPSAGEVSDFKVSYYMINENTGDLQLPGVKNAIAAGKYLYVIEFADDSQLDDTHYIENEFTAGTTAFDENVLENYTNVGYLYISSGAEEAQKPIYFKNQTVNAKITDTVSNVLVNPNTTSAVTYESTDESVAKVDKDTGAVTIMGVGSTVIIATSHIDNTSDVYASYTLNVTKEVIKVTPKDKTIQYGEEFTNNGYDISKPGVILSGVAVYSVDYNQGDGIGKYEIKVSGLTSDLYDIEYQSGKLMVEAKTLTKDDFDVEVSNKTYDASKTAVVSAKVSDSKLVSGDKVTVLVSGEFESADVGNKNVNYEITGLSGKDSNNYVLSGDMTASKSATIEQAEVTVSVPGSATYVYDGEEKNMNVLAYANGTYFDDFEVSYRKTDEVVPIVGLPRDVGVYNVSVNITNSNYKLKGTVSSTLTIKAAQQDFFSIEGISDTVTYGDVLNLSAAGAISGGTVTYKITAGSEVATLDTTSNKITTKGVGTVTVEATSTKTNYVTKTASRTFVIRPKTISVTAQPTEVNREYDGSTNVDVVLTPTGVLSGDSVTVSKVSASVVSPDVENNKTVFVNGLSIDNGNYQLSSTSVQTNVNITKKKVTAVEFNPVSKDYDGSTAAQYTVENLVGVIEADKNYVTAVGDAVFNSANVNEANEVILSNIVLSGAKSGNYELAEEAKTSKKAASITKATVNFTFGTLTYVYDGSDKTVPISATVDGKAFSGYSVAYDLNTIFSPSTAASVKNVGKYGIVITLDDSDNYQSDYESAKQIEILIADQSAMTITGLLGTIDYGKKFALSAVGGSNEAGVETTWNSSDETIAKVDALGNVEIVGVDKEVTITATKTDKTGNHKPQSASVKFAPTKKSVSYRINNLSQTYDGSAKSVNVTSVDPNPTIMYFDESGAAVTAPTNAGTYYVEVKSSAMYDGAQSAVLTIKKAKRTEDISVTVMAGGTVTDSVVYGTDYSVDTTYNGIGGTITYTGTGIYGEQTEKPVNAGNYTAIFTLEDANYETVVAKKTFAVTKKEIVAKPDDKSRAYGENNPEFTLSFTGFVDGDTEEDILIKPTASTDAHSSSSVGTYDIVAKGGYADNYYFTYTPGTLTVVAAKGGNFYISGGNANPYVGNEFTLTAYYNNELPKVEWTSSDEKIATVDKGTGKVTILTAGDVTITATMKDENYKDENSEVLSAQFKITAAKKRITLSASANELVKVYNGKEQPVTFTSDVDLTDVKVNTSYVMTTNVSKNTPKDVGTYAVSYSVDDPRYEGSGNFILVINKATVTVSADAVSKEYGEEPEWKLVVSDNVDGMNAESIKQFVTITSDGAAKTAKADVYDINVALSKTSDDNCDYVVNAEANGKLTVTKAMLTVSVEDITREYLAENPKELVYTITGFKNDENSSVLTGSIAPVYAETIEEKVGTQKDVVAANCTFENENYDINVAYADGLGADLTITQMPVNASAGTARAAFITINLDKAVANLTAENFVVKNGEDVVTLTDVETSDNRSYTLKGSFTVGTTYSVEIVLTGDNNLNCKIVSDILNIKPSSPSSFGGGGGSSTPATYTVTFETNGAEDIDSVKVEKNKTVSEPSEPVKDGFKFDGWYTDKALTKAYDFDTKVTKSFTLYAKWIEDVKEPDDGNDDDNKDPVQSEWKNPFRDVKEDDWFFESVKFANQNGLMSGVGADEFAPNDTLTRGMLVAILYRAEGEPAVNKGVPFADVDANAYYADAVNWAQQNGIVSGYSETEFAPDDNITREQIAAIVYRYAEFKGVAPEGAWAVKLDYEDVAQIYDYAVEGVMYCTLKGIMQGKGNGMFAPKDNATRAEIAAILQRFIEVNK